MYEYEMVTKFTGNLPIESGLRELDSMFDRTFRQICESGWANESDGNVEAPCGYFFIVEIPEKGGELDELIDACEVGREYDDGTFQYPLPAPGWYIAVTDSNGLWWVFGSDTGAESVARRDYNERVEAFSLWNDQD
jgi:hypothetical protein